MANPAYSHAAQYDSDYGSDFSSGEAEIISQLLSTSDSIFNTHEDNPIVNEIEYHDPSKLLRIPRMLGQESRTRELSETTLLSQREIIPFNPGHPDLSRVAEAVSAEYNGSTYHVVDEDDSRSPLQRFRAQPKKALSVTDLVSPSWCELQYFYTLKYHGRKRRTPAMKAGSTIHQELEEQVYTTVKVDIETKEDAWGLRMWNVIQGLRTLHENGQTRELEIWGVIHGQVVNGIIDELSFTCPDVELEENLVAADTKAGSVLPADQSTISDFFQTNSVTHSSASGTKAKRKSQANKVYLCDVKTRGGRTLPSGAAFRPTQYQLMVYYHLLKNISTAGLDFSILAERYDLDANKQFSDSFIAQIGSLNESRFPESATGGGGHGLWDSSQDSITTVLSHSSPGQLWDLMLSHYKTVTPILGSVLKAEYRSRTDGEILGIKTFPMDERVLEQYLDRGMEWWKGERQPRGVAIEEAFKCRSCDFADSCEWRLGKIKAHTQTARAKQNESNKSKAEVAKRGPGRPRKLAKLDQAVVESNLPSDSD